MHAAVFHYPFLFYSISVTYKGTNSNDIIDIIKSDSVLRAVINLHWFEWRFPIHKLDSVSKYTLVARYNNAHVSDNSQSNANAK